MFPGSVTILSLGTVFYLSTAVASRIMPGPEIPLVLYFAHGTALPTVTSDPEREILESVATCPRHSGAASL
jgi:hypothetical protein